MTRGAAADERPNFVPLRVLAAVAVIYDHSFPLARGTSEPLSSWIGYADAGTLALYTFFGISGYLLMSSWSLDPRPLVFATKRILRIVPGLAVAMLFAAYAVGFAMSTLSAGDYLRSPQTLAYVLWNVILFRPQYALPGTFAHNVYPVAVNGSIWSLSYEALLYAFVPLIALVALRWRRTPCCLLIVAAVVIPWDRLASAVPVLELSVANLLPFARCFVAGALLFAYRRHIPRHWAVAVGLAALFVLSWGHPWAPWVGYAVIPYEAVYVAHLRWRPLQLLGRRRDLSYGIYLYAFPVQQTVATLYPGISPWVLCAVATPMSVCYAMISWTLVEEPALRIRAWFRPRQPARNVGTGLVRLPA